MPTSLDTPSTHFISILHKMELYNGSQLPNTRASFTFDSLVNKFFRLQLCFQTSPTLSLTFIPLFSYSLETFVSFFQLYGLEKKRKIVLFLPSFLESIESNYLCGLLFYSVLLLAGLDFLLVFPRYFCGNCEKSEIKNGPKKTKNRGNEAGSGGKVKNKEEKSKKSRLKLPKM